MKTTSRRRASMRRRCLLLAGVATFLITIFWRSAKNTTKTVMATTRRGHKPQQQQPAEETTQKLNENEPIEQQKHRPSNLTRGNTANYNTTMHVNATLVAMQQEEDSDDALEEPINSSSSFSSSLSVSRPPQPLSSLPLCSRDQVRNGQWVPSYRGHRWFPYPPVFHNDAGMAECIALYEQNQTLQFYDWIPNDAAAEVAADSTSSSVEQHSPTCVFTKWNVSQVCQVMNNKTLLIQGDSLSEEHFHTLVQLLKLGNVRMVPGKDFTHQCPSSDTTKGNGSSNTFRIVYRRDDFLLPTKLQWELDDKFPEYVVLNRGAHYQDDDVFEQGIRQLLPALQQWQARCRAFGKRCLLLWRTTVPGIPGCDAKFEADDENPQYANQPPFSHQNNITAMEAWIRANGRKYQWHKFKPQNELAVSILSNTTLDFLPLDAYDINVLRADHGRRRRDCLHTCWGVGKVEVYSQVLLHYMLAHEQQEKQAQTEEREESLRIS